ncbi:aldehyde dehydrogenase family protein [Bradyrhizobium sp. Arg314]
MLSVRAIAAALAPGNAVVHKPDPRTAISGGIIIARIFEEAGLPKDVLQIVPGGADAGEALCTDPNIAMVSFTGSARGGPKVGELCGKHLKKVQLELGGKNARIVLDDADLDIAAPNAARGAFLHQGQICMATGLILAHWRRARHARFRGGRFGSDAEAIEIANMSDYGLAAGVISAAVGRAMALGEQFNVGQLHINDQTANGGPFAPFGGRGRSGNGSRIGGPADIEDIHAMDVDLGQGPGHRLPVLIRKQRNAAMNLSGKTIVVTGASSGIGGEVARLARFSGARVFGVDRNDPLITLDGFVKVDLGDPAGIDATIAAP